MAGSGRDEDLELQGLDGWLVLEAPSALGVDIANGRREGGRVG